MTPTTVDLTALFESVQASINSNLSAILGVGAMIIGITVVIRLFKRVAK